LDGIKLLQKKVVLMRELAMDPVKLSGIVASVPAQAHEGYQPEFCGGTSTDDVDVWGFVSFVEVHLEREFSISVDLWGS
jgi:hypothetical protein